ncbi:MAG: hypothetical protein U0Y10_06380 [Spirosomataceae bacterium]
MKIKELVSKANKALTILNLFLIGIVTFGNIPKKYRERTMSGAINMVVLLLLMVVIVSYALKE